MKKCLFVILCILMVIDFSCKKKEEPPVPYAVFKVNGVKKNYPEYSRFSKDFCSSSTYCCKFFPNKESQNMVVFSLWEGQGGWAKGNFSGFMKTATGDSIEILDGYFENQIWTQGTK